MNQRTVPFDDSSALPPRMRSARIVQVIEAVACEGRGVLGDVSREVTYYYSTAGELLAKCDLAPPCAHRWTEYTPGHRDTPIHMCPDCDATREIPR